MEMKMRIVKRNVASINNNDQELDRVTLSIASEKIDGRQQFFIISDTDEDEGHRFNTIKETMEAIDSMWGKSPEWNLQYN